jgi:putative transposase
MKSSHSYHSLNYHIVFATKNRLPLLDKQVWLKLRQDLQDKAKELNSIIHIANGYYDHIHMLVSLPPTLSVSTAIKHFKGFTSHAIPELFWQNGYYAFTIDQRAFETIFGYIKNQWAHHEKQSLIDELDILIATGLNPWQ